MTTVTVSDSLKMLRETLCRAQTAMAEVYGDGHWIDVERIQRMVDDIDRQRPLSADGTAIRPDDEQLPRGDFSTSDGSAGVSQGGTLPRGYIGLAVSVPDAKILINAIEAFNEEYASPDEVLRLNGIAAAVKRETLGT